MSLPPPPPPHIHLLVGQLHVIWSRVALPASALLPGLLQELLGAQLQFAPSLLQVLLTAALTRGNQASSGLLSEDVITGG